MMSLCKDQGQSLTWDWEKAARMPNLIDLHEDLARVALTGGDL